MSRHIGAIRAEAKACDIADPYNFAFKHFLKVTAPWSLRNFNLPVANVRAWRGGCRTMRTILHLGAHRTASTTFQAFVQANEALLRAHGIAAWTPERTRAGLFSGLIRRPEEITIQTEKRALRSSGLIRVEIERHARQGLSHLVVSEENMIGATRNNLRARLLYPMVDERLMRFREGFGEACDRIVLSIRAYDAFWASSLAYAVAQGTRLPDAGMLDRLVAQPRRWRDVVRDIAQCFPKAEVLVLPFERFAGRPKTQVEMMTGQRLPSNGFAGLDEWRNPSPALPALRRILGYRSDLPADRLLPAGEGRWMPFDTDQRLELTLAYQADLTWLRDGAEGFARFIEDPEEILTHPEANGAGASAAERTAVPDQRGQIHDRKGPSRAVV